MFNDHVLWKALSHKVGSRTDVLSILFHYWKNEQQRTTSRYPKPVLQPRMDYNRSYMLLLKYGIRCLMT